MTVTHGPVVIRRRLGHVLKQLRVSRDLQLSQVAKQLEVSPSKLSRIETGQVDPKFRDVRDLLEIYEAPEETREQVFAWATDAKAAPWWQPFSATIAGADLDMLISLEAEARKKRNFSLPVAGLLQTETYARSLLRNALVNGPETEVERLVEIRMGRQSVIEPDRNDAPPLELHVVLDEAGLHRIADPSIMDGQIRTLLRRSDQPNVTLQVLPFSAGWSRATSTFSLFQPRESTADWPVVNVESTGSDSYFDSEIAVSSYEQIWENVLTHALCPEDTRRLLRDRLDD